MRVDFRRFFSSSSGKFNGGSKLSDELLEMFHADHPLYLKAVMQERELEACRPVAMAASARALIGRMEHFYRAKSVNSKQKLFRTDFWTIVLDNEETLKFEGCPDGHLDSDRPGSFREEYGKLSKKIHSSFTSGLTLPDTITKREKCSVMAALRYAQELGFDETLLINDYNYDDFELKDD